jgi:hypothetical protein
LAFLAQQEKNFRAVADELFELRYLTTDEWINARLSLAIKIEDRRSMPEAPLPDLSK